MAISNVGKIAYIFNNGTWHPLAGMTDTSADFDWTGDHEFDGSVTIDGASTINGAMTVKNSVNYFNSSANRDASIPTPPAGTVAYVVSNSVLQPQFYFGGQWNIFGSNAYLDEKTASHTIALSDAGKTIDLNFSTSGTVTIPLNSNVAFPLGAQIAFIRSGAGAVTFAGESSGGTSVTILSKNSNKSIAARYTQAILVKKAENTWYLFGDLTV